MLQYLGLERRSNSSVQQSGIKMILSCPHAKLRLIILSLALSCLPFVCTPASAVQMSGAITLANGKCLDAEFGRLDREWRSCAGLGLQSKPQSDLAL